ncbi:hypothetical protein H8356DRAFT_1350633 [Neocallimastix lanati (nom. inval.)]|nr:hypothetical protein H8356DRAFT_1350633 [Neocallimastix sp. JGI-2020a]
MKVLNTIIEIKNDKHHYLKHLNNKNTDGHIESYGQLNTTNSNSSLKSSDLQNSPLDKTDHLVIRNANLKAMMTQSNLKGCLYSKKIINSNRPVFILHNIKKTLFSTPNILSIQFTYILYNTEYDMITNSNLIWYMRLDHFYHHNINKYLKQNHLMTSKILKIIPSDIVDEFSRRSRIYLLKDKSETSFSYYKKCFITFIDEFSRRSRIYLLKDKSEMESVTLHGFLASLCKSLPVSFTQYYLFFTKFHPLLILRIKIRNIGEAFDYQNNAIVKKKYIRFITMIICRKLHDIINDTTPMLPPIPVHFQQSSSSLPIFSLSLVHLILAIPFSIHPPWTLEKQSTSLGNNNNKNLNNTNLYQLVTTITRTLRKRKTLGVYMKDRLMLMIRPL